VWNADTGRSLFANDAPFDWPNSIVFSPDGTTLTTTDSEFAREWDVIKGTVTSVKRISQRVNSRVFIIRLEPDPMSADGGVLAKVEWERDEGGRPCFRVRVRDKSGTELFALRFERESVKDPNMPTLSFQVAAVSADGRRVACASPTVRMFDVPSGRLRWTAQGHQGTVRAMEFSPDGRLLATGSEDRTVRVWSAADGKLLATFRGHSSGVECIAFSPDGKRLASGSMDTTVLIWDTADLR